MIPSFEVTNIDEDSIRSFFFSSNGYNSYIFIKTEESLESFIEFVIISEFNENETKEYQNILKKLFTANLIDSLQTFKIKIYIYLRRTILLNVKNHFICFLKTLNIVSGMISCLGLKMKDTLTFTSLKSFSSFDIQSQVEVEVEAESLDNKKSLDSQRRNKCKDISLKKFNSMGVSSHFHEKLLYGDFKTNDHYDEWLNNLNITSLECIDMISKYMEKINNYN